GVAVEEEAARGILLREAVANDLAGQLVGHEIAGIEDGGDLLAEVGALLDVGAEDVAGGDHRDAEGLGHADALRPLARALRADGERPGGGGQRRSPSWWRCCSCASICFTVSRPTPTMMRIEAPPNGKFWLAWTVASAISGMSATMPRYSEPGNVMRVIT